MKLSLKLDNLITLGNNIWVFVITGGPCGGKSSVLAYLVNMLSDRGFKVFILPEIATKLMNEGIKPGVDGLTVLQFQERVLLDTISQEQCYFAKAKWYRDQGYKVVILCDRGTLDGEAYVDRAEFAALIKSFGLSPVELCDHRYHAVMHLRTAALGAEKFYTLANNVARKETLEEARRIDQRTLEAWQRHPHPRVIDNSTDFKEKIRRLFIEVCAVIGDPIPLEQEDKFLIEPFDPESIPVPYSISEITQDYLMSPSLHEVHRLRCRSSKEGATFFHTVKSDLSPGVRYEHEKIISDEEYHKLLAIRNVHWKTVRKCRITFFYLEQFFEIDIFQEPCNGLYLMEAEQTDRSKGLKLPDFVKVIENVTHDKRYSNAAIAKYGQILELAPAL